MAVVAAAAAAVAGAAGIVRQFGEQPREDQGVRGLRSDNDAGPEFDGPGEDDEAGSDLPEEVGGAGSDETEGAEAAANGGEEGDRPRRGRRRGRRGGRRGRDRDRNEVVAGSEQGGDNGDEQNSSGDVSPAEGGDLPAGLVHAQPRQSPGQRRSRVSDDRRRVESDGSADRRGRSSRA